MNRLEQNKDEYAERERALAKFLARNDPTRASLNSYYGGGSRNPLNLESLRGSIEITPKN